MEHDSTEENLRTLRDWLERYGRPLALYTDKSGLFMTSRPVQWQEQLRAKPARTQIGRALSELDIEWIAAHSPQPKGCIGPVCPGSERRRAKWHAPLRICIATLYRVSPIIPNENRNSTLLR